MAPSTVMTAPMISSPLKATNEIDWITPLKSYIRSTYGDDPERYAEECATLNRLRQDMRGAGKDSAAGRDLLYRYYGQLELLDLRFPVDENHIKISFTWFDAFTQKPTAQYSLAYEKASIIFNISAVLSCHAARQNRNEETGLKTAYHSFQASAGMFTYINENFLHAPSTDLSRETISTLISIMLAQGQEVFLEKQIADEKKVGLLAKLASQAAYLYSQAAEGIADGVSKGIFERVWNQACQIKQNYMGSLAQYYQALAENDANSHGMAIARLQVAERLGKEANKLSASFPSSVPAESNLSSETGQTLADMTKRHLSTVQDKLREFSKDNDFIYHQTVPTENSLSIISKLPASKAIPVSELYAGQDIQRIIGPDIFQRIVPMAVTESASLYDEEKAKLVRAEAERVETMNSEMDASLDYLKLPGSLKVLKGGIDQEYVVDDEFRQWCDEFVGHEPLDKAFDTLREHKKNANEILASCSQHLDEEEYICEKMRLKHGAAWTQQPSAQVSSMLRNDIGNYRQAIETASINDGRLFSQYRQYEPGFKEMQAAAEADEADVLFQREMVKAGASKGKDKSPTSPQQGSLLDEDFGDGPTVAEQIAKVEELLKKLNLIKKDRNQVLKDLKEKVKNDDISNVLILNKKSITNQESQLFQAELEKFRNHQTRLLQAQHKQSSLMKELTSTYSALLQDKRVRSEQSKFEALTRQRNSVLARYKKVYDTFVSLSGGLAQATKFYTDMNETLLNVERNVEMFVQNRKDEGARLMESLPGGRSSGRPGSSRDSQSDKDRERLKGVIEQMSRLSAVDPNQHAARPNDRPPSVPVKPYQQAAMASPPVDHRYSTMSTNYYGQPPPQAHGYASPYGAPSAGYQPGAPVNYNAMSPTNNDPYNPSVYRPRDSYMPPPQQVQSQAQPPPNAGQLSYMPNQYHQPQSTYYPPQPAGAHGQPPSYIPHNYVPPPPPAGPPPIAPQQSYPTQAVPGYIASQSDYPQQQQQQQQNGQHGDRSNGGDPWAGLSAWK